MPEQTQTVFRTRGKRARRVYDAIKQTREEHGEEAAIEVLLGALTGAEIRAYRAAGLEDASDRVLLQEERARLRERLHEQAVQVEWSLRICKLCDARAPKDADNEIEHDDDCLLAGHAPEGSA